MGEMLCSDPRQEEAPGPVLAPHRRALDGASAHRATETGRRGRGKVEPSAARREMRLPPTAARCGDKANVDRS
jgi:hypothetical protein